MMNVIAKKRGLVIILVLATIFVFIGLVWAIITYLPFNSAASPNPSSTIEAPRTAMNCVSPVEYWMYHPEYYPGELVIADKVYLAKEINGVLEQRTSDLPAVLQAQLVAAYLNILSGAEPSYIQATIFEAYGWLVKHPSGSQLEAGDQEEGFRLFNLLEAYNRGQTGVEPCEIAYPILETQISENTETATATITDTVSASETILASETPQPTDTETYAPVYTYVVPTRTHTPTTEAPSYSTPIPTSTTAPTQITPPTNTPKPEVTLPPTATNTPDVTLPPPP